MGSENVVLVLHYFCYERVLDSFVVEKNERIRHGKMFKNFIC